MERQAGKLFIGEAIEPESGDRSGEAVLLNSADFTTHGVIVGMTGSGKTGLGVVLLEEALQSGIPVLAIDPKGDLSNLCLTFPGLSGPEFEPWMDEGVARVEGTSVSELATKTAEMWRTGLDSWGLGPDDVAALAKSADPIVYTPGSTAGVPLNAMGNLTPPASDDPAVRQDEADSTITGLLGLVGVDSDPLSGREHILLANLITRAWDEGIALDLPTLLGQLMDPQSASSVSSTLRRSTPQRIVKTSSSKLNGLLASPSFAAWAEGAPLDISTMLWKPNGDPRAAIVSLGHLEESERHFAITLVLSKLISWMRSQAGTGELRVLVYIDEVMGLAPPTANPSPKKPILTLLKQASVQGWPRALNPEPGRSRLQGHQQRWHLADRSAANRARQEPSRRRASLGRRLHRHWRGRAYDQWPRQASVHAPHHQVVQSRTSDHPMGAQLPGRAAHARTNRPSDGFETRSRLRTSGRAWGRIASRVHSCASGSRPGRR
ncbi:MAG: helicase HerA-like domain-containing protein [Acidimicrobiales bacterium]